MIDRESKKIINGFGTILLGCCGWNTLTVGYAEPPKEIGEKYLNGTVEKLDKIEFTLTRDEWEYLLNKLSDVSDNNSKIQFRDWEINFEKYNPKSVKAWRKKLMGMNMFVIPLAC